MSLYCRDVPLRDLPSWGSFPRPILSEPDRNLTGVDPVRSRTMLRQAELSRDLFVVLMWQVPA